jgi:benzoyl-CoA 2,3-dioxygenase component B
MFTDRDGKYQLAALAESGFDPLARSTQFMLTEEAHHLFVGETGLGRIVKRTAELMQGAKNEDVRPLGGIPLDIIQKYINEWYSASIDLFGGEDSSNAATFFGAGLKGRFKEAESSRYTDHIALDSYYQIALVGDDQKIRTEDIPMRRAMNALLRDAYTEDCERALKRWNETLEKEGVPQQLSLPSIRFNRNMGVYAGYYFDPQGNLISKEQFDARRDSWLPIAEDYAYVRSLMHPVYERGKIANWIAPPMRGINSKPFDFEYVRHP